LNTEGGPRESCISTVVDASSLELQVTGNTQASLGERTTFHIEMLNRSNADVRGLRLRAEFDRGLEHYDPALAGPATNSERGILERTMDQVIPAGGSLPVDITFTTTASGQQCVRVRAESVGAAASDQACVQVQDTPPLPQSALQLRPIGTELTTPLRVGDRRRYDIVFVNTGISPLTDVTIDVEADGAMEISDSSIGYERTDFGLVWRIPRLEPGQRSTHQVEIRAESPSTQACLQVTATSRERTAEQHRDCPPIYGPGGTFPDRGGAVPSPSDSDLFDRPTPGPGEESRGANTLKLEFRTLSSNVVVNRPTNLYVRLINDAIYDIQDVQIRLRLSPGLELIDASGQGLGYRPSPDGRTITFDNILTIRPRDQITVEIRVRPVSVGQVSATVEVEGEQLIQPLEQQQQLTVTN